MNEIEQFQCNWRAWYGNLPPSHFTLLKTLKLNHLRICALPKCGWYDRTPRQFRTIVGRMDKLATSILGPNGKFFAVTNRKSGEKPFDLPALEMNRVPSLAWQETVWTYTDHQRSRMEGNPLFCNSGHRASIFVDVGKYQWSPLWYEHLLAYRDSDARHEPDNLFINPVSGICIGTYDEGFDIFAPKPEALNYYRRKFRAWEYDEMSP